MGAETLEFPELRDAARLTVPLDESYDAVIVGSGAGGAVLAKELAEGGMRVVIVEEGGFHRVHRDEPYAALTRLYRDAGISGTMGKPAVLVPLGRCFGGTTTINSGTCFRTPDSVLAHWRNYLGLKGIEPGEMRQVFDRVEQELNVTEVPFGLLSRGVRKLHELLLQEGFRGAPLRRNVRDCEGCGVCCYGCTSGAKQSMDRCYLPKALRAGGVAYVNARAKQILIDRTGCATGIVAEAGGTSGRRLTLRAPIVAIACGTLLSPQFLKVNRIARGNPHLGRHLTLHPATKVYAEFAERMDDWRGVPQSYFLDAFHDDGLMFEGASMPPDLGTMGMPLVGAPLARFIKNYGNMASFGFMISDTTEGYMVRVPGAGHLFKYTLTETDLRRIRRGIAFLSRVYLKGGARAVYPLLTNEFSVMEQIEDVDRFENTPLRGKDVEMLAFHPLGTCRMAATADAGVCDQDHQVFGTPGLYVCDGSVVPSALGVNPQITIMGLATRLAGRLLATR